MAGACLEDVAEGCGYSEYRQGEGVRAYKTGSDLLNR